MKPVHILLVEDNEGDIILIAEALEEGKVKNTISIARNGWDAMQYLERKPGYENVIMPDLILLDVNLPKLNGHEVLMKIKSSEHLRHIPVIMLTTSSSEADIYKAYKNHVNCYITKPVDVKNFIKVITSIENFWVTIVQIPDRQKH